MAGITTFDKKGIQLKTVTICFKDGQIVNLNNVVEFTASRYFFTCVCIDIPSREILNFSYDKDKVERATYLNVVTSKTGFVNLNPKHVAIKSVTKNKKKPQIVEQTIEDNLCEA